jgi:hypothetical protein
VIESCAGDLAQRIRSEQNYAYVPDIRVPGVVEWVARSGLSAEECAMIQPAYQGRFIEEFTAVSEGDAVHLSWDFSGVEVNFIRIFRNGEVVFHGIDPSLAEMSEFYDRSLPTGEYTYELLARSRGDRSDSQGSAVHDGHRVFGVTGRKSVGRGVVAARNCEQCHEDESERGCLHDTSLLIGNEGSASLRN